MADAAVIGSGRSPNCVFSSPTGLAIGRSIAVLWAAISIFITNGAGGGCHAKVSSMASTKACQHGVAVMDYALSITFCRLTGRAFIMRPEPRIGVWLAILSGRRTRAITI